MSNKTRTKKFMQNSLSTALYQVVVMLVGFVTPRIILQYYGSELNGLVSSINQFISYLALVEAGIAGAAVYALYKPLASEDHDGISSIVSATKNFYNQSGWMFTGLIAIMALVYPFFIKTEELGIVEVMLLVVVLGSKSFLEFFTLAKYRVILTADQRTYVVSNASSVYVLLQMIIIVVLSVLRVNVVIVYTVAIAALLTRSIILMIYVKRNYPYINYKAKPNKEALNQRWDALFLQILGAAQTGAPILIATVFTTLEEVSIYAVYNMVVSGINGVLSIFVNGLSAGFGDLIARKEQKKLQYSYKDFEYAYYILITVVYSVTAIMLLPFVKIYTKGITDAEYVQPLIAVLFALNGLLYNLKTPQGTLIISAGMYRETRYRSLIQALIIIVGGVILAPIWGLVGILIASCLSNLYRVIDLLFFVPKHITKLPVRRSAFRIVFTTVLCVLIYLPFAVFNFSATGIIDWVVKAALVSALALVVTVVANLIFERKQLLYVLVRIKYMFKR